MSSWTTPYYGLTHLGRGESGKRRVSVQAYEGFAILHRWFPGCGFSPLESQHKDAEEAKRDGEKWMKEGNV